jgi:hypothetical protein
MKIPSLVPILSLSIFLLACNGDKKKTTNTVSEQKDSIEVTPVLNKDSLLLETGKHVLTSLKNKDYNKLSTYFDDDISVRFSPYGYIDTVTNRQFNKQEFDTLIKNNNVILWGNYDGSGDAMNLTPKQYFEKFVYNADFLDAEKTALDSIIGTGNSLININQVYPGARFIEYHFRGFDKKYNGMDWTSLRLVFKEINRSYKLIAIVHDQWTI